MGRVDRAASHQESCRAVDEDHAQDDSFASVEQLLRGFPPALAPRPRQALAVRPGSTPSPQRQEGHPGAGRAPQAPSVPAPLAYASAASALEEASSPDTSAAPRSSGLPSTLP